ncbi:U32 family peptidase [Paratractidigestivibacter sp.]|uniref:U32 family peptidase n=1 Tax=Paratractidigestivibacter sp. TaxID=2847316 RepID=UPI002ABDD319|nr:U32 family peptidase [Paratractidigestivibacter sp.]
MAHKNVIELLAPAGGPESFNAALAAGADAIYCGLGSSFNARRSADNFDDEGFAAACRSAHLAGTRVYVTINVAVATDEMPRLLRLVRRAWLFGADAFIIQDWGVFSEVRRLWPQIETHISTQANIHDARGVAWCRERGADRVTLSRELSLTEIRRIAREGVELECFGHGALCFCYSGVCMMSSLAGDRSANRGLCAQPCRLPYELIDEEGRMVPIPDVATAGMAETMRGVGGTRALCPKDYCLVDHIDEMILAGVGSLKVEGRMKAPDYVYQVVSAYRRAIDASIAGRALSDEESGAVHRQLKRAFNRDFTDAYLLGLSDNRMMSYERSNNRGEVVGEVVSGRKLEDLVERRGGGNGGRTRMRRFSRAEVTIRLTQPVGAGDLLEVRPVSDPTQFLTVTAERDSKASEVICATAPRVMEAGAIVRVIRSQAALAAAARVAKADVQRKRPVYVRVVARLGQPFVVELACVDGEAAARAEGFVVEEAKTRPVGEDDLVAHVGRMGGGPFEPVSYDVELDDGCGMGFSAVHKVRAEAVRALEEALLAGYAAREEGMAKAPSEYAIAANLEAERADHGLELRSVGIEETCVCALVTDPACARAAFAAGAARVYAAVDDLAAGEWPQGVIPWLDGVCREADHDRLDQHVVAGKPCAVGNMSELALAAELGAAPEIRSCVPVHNESCLVTLEAAGAAGFWLSHELTLEQICELARRSSVPVGLMVYGRERAMTSEHCVLQVMGKCIHDCARCPQRKRRLSLRNIEGKLLPVRTDINGRSRIWAAQVLDATPESVELLAAGVTRFLADCTLLDEAETRQAIARVAAALDAARVGKRPAEREAGATSGHLYAPIK